MITLRSVTSHRSRNRWKNPIQLVAPVSLLVVALRVVRSNFGGCRYNSRCYSIDCCHACLRPPRPPMNRTIRLVKPSRDTAGCTCRCDSLLRPSRTRPQPKSASAANILALNIPSHRAKYASSVTSPHDRQRDPSAGSFSAVKPWWFSGKGVCVCWP